ncbi:hypothetical protein DE146DRAFT_732098 [Phaeosphaeria sp. MPI-PUGE-AT-0046c]|nr:hypothetical protein DE146DRAFT_732098 [Phaeosphaeria sp. MPI-PUGE-AT-0046c]
MRLLQLQDSGGISLVEVFDPLPPYAILSHTWGADDEEVSFRDLMDMKGEGKPGYQKLNFCGKQAASNGLEYFWVDTCCIDKSSSAELTESINSMFRWYHNSSACFVYMSDVFVGMDGPDKSLQCQQDFQKSRWFTRGWTLQELLAPKSVQFFSRDGQLLGDKLSMHQRIHEITRIAHDALRGISLDRFSIEERMSWAVGRTTRREEDEAYSLLGLCGVHMPMIYGEGRQSAFNRLRKEIRYMSELSTGNLENDKRRAILDKILVWLEPADPSSNYEQALKKRQENTGLWFLQSEQYKSWKKLSQSFLWLHGIPGAGKTILSSTIIADLLQHSYGNTQIAVVYFYLDFNDPQKQAVDAMLRSLIAQLSQYSQRISSELIDLFAQCMQRKGQPSIETLLKLSQQLISEFSRVYLVLDALDECSQRAELMQVLTTMSLWRPQNTHMLVTSRLERDIEVSIMKFSEGNTRVILDSAVVDEDIRQYVRQRLADDQALKKWHGDPDLRQEIENTLIQGSQGMFRWAVCQLDTLGKCRTRARLRASLTALPPTLEKTYDRVLCNINEEDSLYSIRILRWLSFANRPLTVDEIAEAVAVDPDRDPALIEEEMIEDPMEALDICSSLVAMVADPGDGLSESTQQYVMLAHYTVKEYLLADRMRTGIAAKYNMQYAQSQRILAKACLLYLLQTLECASSLDDIVTQRKLLHYCAGHWMHHAKEANDWQSDLASLALRLLTQESTYTKWLKLHDDADTTPYLEEIPHPSFYAARYGLADIFELLLDVSGDVTAASIAYTDALQEAAFQGHQRIVQQLLVRGAEINALCVPWGSALQAACAGGHEQTIKLLVNTGADVNASGGMYDSALEISICNGSTAMVELLLEHGADASRAHRHGWGPLHHVAQNGCVDKAILLLSHGADVLAIADNGMTCVRVAAEQGHLSLVQLFHDSGADLSFSDYGGWGCTPFFAAVGNGHYDIVKLLLEYSKESTAPKGLSRTHDASSCRTGSNAQSKIRRSDSNPALEDARGEHAASRAAARGFDAVLALMFESSASDPNYRDCYGRSLIWWAAAHGQAATVEFLQHVHGCDPGIPDACHRTPLIIAAKKGHQRVVEILKSAKDNVRVSSDQIQGPDHQAGLYCDVCTISIATSGFHYHCRICANGDWDVCSECYGCGVICRDPTHVLTKRTMSDGEWVEVE